MKKYTLNRYEAHTVSQDTVIVPDEVADNQHDYDGRTFPVIKRGGKRGRAMLMGDYYGLNTHGTGDMIVRITR